MNVYHTLELIEDPRGFTTLWLNRPHKRNAFDARMIAELLQALEQLEADNALRLLLIRGRGEHFCAGADLAWMQQAADLDYASNLRDAQTLSELMQRLARLPVPTLAVVQGSAFGGALGLVSACDMALASDNAQFSLSEVRIGLIPAVISPYVMQAIGERATRRYALSAERFDGLRARQLGLIAECYPAQQLDDQALRWVDNLLLNSPQAMRACKALLHEMAGRQPDDHRRQYCETAIARIRTSAEGQEGLRAFLDKRTPQWQQDPEPKP